MGFKTLGKSLQFPLNLAQYGLSSCKRSPMLDILDVRLREVPL